MSGRSILPPWSRRHRGWHGAICGSSPPPSILSGTTSFYGNTNLTGLEIALRPSSTIVLLFINTGAALVYYVVARLVLEQEKLVALQQKNYALAMQSLQYENLQERIAEARQAKHDVRHHIALLQDCLRRKDYDAMQAYLDRYQETLPDARQLQFCGNAAVNAVLSYFAQQAAAQQVEFSVKAQLPEYTGVADPDSGGAVRQSA
mgnify:FL=1